MHLDAAFLHNAVQDAQIVQGQLDGVVTFSLDSRTINESQLFIPVKGEKVDGHDFIELALEKGKGAFVARDVFASLSSVFKKFPFKVVIVVDNPQEALFKIAAAWRAQFRFPIIAVTGSVGKTSTKLLVAAIFKAAGKNCFASTGNQNTLFGVALNIAQLTHEHESAVFEVGISKPGEMAKIVQLLQPTTAIITCIGHSHMEGLGSLAGIAAEKRDIFKFFKEDSIGIINGDQPLLNAVGYAHPVIRFGQKTTNQVQARKIKVNDESISCILKIYGQRYDVTVPGNHQGQLNNILAAAAVTHYLGVDPLIIVDTIQKPLVKERRFQSCKLKDHKGILIDDAYNASPESMKAALLALQSLKSSGKKIAVLGDMLELGGTSAFWHRQIGRFLRKITTLEHLILVGNEVHWTHKTAPVGLDIKIVPSWKEAVDTLRETLKDESVVLVKGSNGVKLSFLVKEFVDTEQSVKNA